MPVETTIIFECYHPTTKALTTRHKPTSGVWWQTTVQLPNVFLLPKDLSV